eukprot:4793822-Prymnesium_polylepis.1
MAQREVHHRQGRIRARRTPDGSAQLIRRVGRHTDGVWHAAVKPRLVGDAPLRLLGGAMDAEAGRACVRSTLAGQLNPPAKPLMRLLQQAPRDAVADHPHPPRMRDDCAVAVPHRPHRRHAAVWRRRHVDFSMPPAAAACQRKGGWCQRRLGCARTRTRLGRRGGARGPIDVGAVDR